MRRTSAFLIALSCAGPLSAQDFSLSIPVDCEIGEDQQCYIQNYVDVDPGPEHQDFNCNALSYNGHKGTDFALRSQLEIADNVAVFAAAPGVVKGIRDGMADRLLTKDNAAEIKGRECGNGLVIDHGDGWETQYCHLKKGSVQVKGGDTVKSGDTVGFIGLSGKTQFPHLHLSVRKDGQQIDPFDPDSKASCNTQPATSLWADPLVYQPGGVIAAGFSDIVPEYADVKRGIAASESLSVDSNALVLWGFAFGSRPGDRLNLEILNSAGQTVFDTSVELEKTQAQFFRAGGRKTKNARWFKAGTYTGLVQLVRDGTVISDTETTVMVTQ